LKSTPPIVSFKGVDRRFKTPDGQLTTALTDINLDIYPGEFVSVIGPSGCGKSTLIRIAADLLAPSNGEVTVNGKPPHETRLNREYGMVFQAATLYEWRNVMKNIELPLEIMGWPPTIRAERAHEMLELVQLSDFASNYPWQLSGGMQQRVAVVHGRAIWGTGRNLARAHEHRTLEHLAENQDDSDLYHTQYSGSRVPLVAHHRNVASAWQDYRRYHYRSALSTCARSSRFGGFLSLGQ